MRIAIVDDDELVRNHMAQLLQNGGYTCSTFVGGHDALKALQRDTFDLMIVDWSMPGLSGIDVLNWVSKNLSKRPAVIMLTSRSEKTDIVKGLEAGADDYIVKPEADNVILARVEARLRNWKPEGADTRTLTFGPYVFDKLECRISFPGHDVALTAKEFQLAQIFFENLHRPLARSYLLDAVWNSAADLATRTLDVHVSRIRTKLKLNAENGYRLHTIFGFGYRLETFDETS
jgi:DNA-binding response OmpR family regulator